MDRIEKRLADMPRAYRRNYLKALGGKSLRAAVNAQCLECMGWHKDEVRKCNCYCCPLHTVRPYQVMQKGRSRGSANTQAAISQEVGV